MRKRRVIRNPFVRRAKPARIGKTKTKPCQFLGKPHPGHILIPLDTGNLEDGTCVCGKPITFTKNVPDWHLPQSQKGLRH